MKKFLVTLAVVSLFSTVDSFAYGNNNRPNNLGNILTINGVPLNNMNWGNSQKPENKPTIPNKPSKPNNNITERPTETTTNSIDNNISNNTNVDEMEVLRLVNIERSRVGLKPLQIDYKVSNIARLKSEDMAKKNYFNHTSPTYGTPFDMLRKFNITYKSAGENIAKGQKNAQAVVKAWMESEGHKRNILSKSFTHIGIGKATRGRTNYWTQVFISK